MNANSRRANYGALQRKDLERRVLAAEAEVEKFMEPEEKYSRQLRSIESEARIRPYLDLIFKDVAGQEPKYHVECHGLVCQISAEQSNAWIGPLQTTYPESTMFGAMSFSDKAFVELLTEGAALANRIHHDAGQWIYACVTADSTPGDLLYQLNMDDSNRVTVQSSGSLANQAVGSCVVNALRTAAAKAPVPPNTRIEDREHRLTLPLDE
jgi:hypothetical protein